MKSIVILSIFSVLSLTGAFAAPIVVKVTGGASDIVRGYYVEYTINGNKYRSDEVGERINDVATGTKKGSPTRYRPVHSAELPD